MVSFGFKWISIYLNKLFIVKNSGLSKVVK